MGPGTNAERQFRDLLARTECNVILVPWTWYDFNTSRWELLQRLENSYWKCNGFVFASIRPEVSFLIFIVLILHQNPTLVFLTLVYVIRSVLKLSTSVIVEHQDSFGSAIISL
jgi:hypothetical protein